MIGIKIVLPRLDTGSCLFLFPQCRGYRAHDLYPGILETTVAQYPIDHIGMAACSEPLVTCYTVIGGVHLAKAISVPEITHVRPCLKSHSKW